MQPVIPLKGKQKKEGFILESVERYKGSLNHELIKAKNPETGEIKEFIYDELRGYLLGEEMD